MKSHIERRPPLIRAAQAQVPPAQPALLSWPTLALRRSVPLK